MLPLLLLLVFSIFFLSGLILVAADHALPAGVSCSSQFASAETALVVPNLLTAWSSYRIFDCQKKVFWLQVDTTKSGEPISITAKVPVIERFQNVRVSGAVIGPSLPTLSHVRRSKSIPHEVLAYAATNSTYGVALFRSAPDQSSCWHLTNQDVFMKSRIVDDRCQFHDYERNTKDWVVLDEVLMAPVPYKLAVFVEGGTSAKASISCGGHYEANAATIPSSADYKEGTFPVVETNCPLCGTRPNENPNWLEYFYEIGIMSAYAGFPSSVSCGQEPSNSALVPSSSDEQHCPPNMHDLHELPVMDDCPLDCQKDGTCRRIADRVDGRCHYNIEWGSAPRHTSGSSTYIVRHLVIQSGDTIELSFSDTQQHSTKEAFFYEMPHAQAMRNCDFTFSHPVPVFQESSNEQQQDTSSLQRVKASLNLLQPGVYRYAKEVRCSSALLSLRTVCECSRDHTLVIEVRPLEEQITGKQPDAYEDQPLIDLK